MLQAATLQLLRNLKANNRKAWVDDHRPAYAAAREDFVDLVSRLLAGLAQLPVPAWNLENACSPLPATCAGRPTNRLIRGVPEKLPG